ncbi:ABC transporter permease [Methanocella sp. CWC-04]|uniref:ABC transporter permease n=1 Tax=Methanooceanicella nereidis TaxID=2052831 RepID=A0AAP2W7P5_9EURY|nr:ABC transporter permease [Methanocella sp. CWC-04]MCD1295424.1 ABC transporter permease [Methanocella sp. CWC-04]
MKKSDRKGMIVQYAITLSIILILNFFLPRMMPGDPFLLLSGDAEGEVVSILTEEQRLYYISYYGLDRPVYEQFISYVMSLFTGDFGMSIYYKVSVLQAIWTHLPWTVLIVLGATIISTLAGISLGIFSAKRREGAADKLMIVGLISFAEIPSFLLGIVLLLTFAVYLKIFPLAGAITPFARYAGLPDQIWDIAYHAFLPMITLAFTQLTGVYLLTRNTLVTVMTRDYIRTARAKGIGERLVWNRHALRNALLPVVTRVGFQLGMLVGGAVLVENVFNYPGIGTLLRNAVIARDYPLIQGIMLVMAISILTANYLVDALYKRLDPRTESAEV